MQGRGDGPRARISSIEDRRRVFRREKARLRWQRARSQPILALTLTATAYRGVVNVGPLGAMCRRLMFARWQLVSSSKRVSEAKRRTDATSSNLVRTGVEDGISQEAVSCGRAKWAETPIDRLALSLAV